MTSQERELLNNLSRNTFCVGVWGLQCGRGKILPEDYQADLGTDPGFDDIGTFDQG
ncbi:MAG: hypothetical protein DSM106950_03830 [Stigonema ocellatum SAG 48.90 = DSM 106950]|nr:hypothetical protein [Stigonema ocellatum SAG 48.90 = DSM 106950]